MRKWSRVQFGLKGSYRCFSACTALPRELNSCDSSMSGIVILKCLSLGAVEEIWADRGAKAPLSER